MIWLWIVMAVLSLGLFIFPYFAYPLLLLRQPKLYPLGEAADPKRWPDVSIILPARNAAERIGDKVKQLRSLDYPGRCEILVVDDGSTDRTAEEAERAGADHVLRLEHQHGKSRAQNQVLQQAGGEVLMFTDAAVEVQADALRNLVRELLSPGVGCVTGVDLSVAADGADANRGAGMYTRFEIALRNLEAQTKTLLGVNGCLFVVRAEHRAPVPAECVDDLYVPLAAVDRGLRVTVAPAAAATVPRATLLREEYRRKVRTFTGGMFTLRRAKNDLPRAYRHLRWRLWGHKWLRWSGPFFAVASLYFSLGLALREPLGWLLVLPQAAFWLAALAGAGQTFSRASTSPFLRAPMFFGMIQVALLHAWVRFWSDRPFIIWEPTRRAN